MYTRGPLRNAKAKIRLIIANVKHITKVAGISIIKGTIIEHIMRLKIDMAKKIIAL